MKFKEGDKVRIKNTLVVDEDYYMEGSEVWDTFTKDMKEYLGMEAVIVDASNEYELDIDNAEWSWTDDMLESID